MLADFREVGGYAGTLNIKLPRVVKECADSNCSTVLRTAVTDYRVPNLGRYVERRILGLARYQLLYDGAEAFATSVEENILPSDCKLRRVKHLNNVIEQAHRAIRRRWRAMLVLAAPSTPPSRR